VRVTGKSDYPGRELLAAMARAMKKGTIRSAKSPGVAGNQEISTVSPKPVSIAASVPRAETDLPISLIIRMGPNAAPSADQAKSTREKISARQTRARTVARTSTTTTVARVFFRNSGEHHARDNRRQQLAGHLEHHLLRIAEVGKQHSC